MSTTVNKKTAFSCANEVKIKLGNNWLADIYKEKVRSLRTRSLVLGLPEKEQNVEIMHTLLGVEVKAGRKRISCPDLATARYLAVFARIGLTNVAVPYEINRISFLADELESSWHRMILLASESVADASDSFQKKVRKSLIDDLRREINEEGYGPAVPQFNQNTKQRKS